MQLFADLGNARVGKVIAGTLLQCSALSFQRLGPHEIQRDLLIVHLGTHDLARTRAGGVSHGGRRRRCANAHGLGNADRFGQLGQAVGAFHLHLQAQSAELILQLGTLEPVSFQELGDFRLFIGIVVGAGGVDLALELAQTVIDDHLKVSTDLLTLGGNGVVHKTIENRDTIDVGRVLQLQTDIAAQRIGFLRIGQNQINGIAVERLKALLKGLPRFLERLEQLLMVLEEPQARIIRVQLCTYFEQRIGRRQLIHFRTVQGV